MPGMTADVQALPPPPPPGSDIDTIVEREVLVWEALGSPAYPTDEDVLREIRRDVERSYDPIDLERQTAAIILAVGGQRERLRRLDVPTVVPHGDRTPPRAGRERPGYRGDHPRRRADHRPGHGSTTCPCSSCRRSPTRSRGLRARRASSGLDGNDHDHTVPLPGPRRTQRPIRRHNYVPDHLAWISLQKSTWVELVGLRARQLDVIEPVTVSPAQT